MLQNLIWSYLLYHWAHQNQYQCNDRTSSSGAHPIVIRWPLYYVMWIVLFFAKPHMTIISINTSSSGAHPIVIRWPSQTWKHSRHGKAFGTSIQSRACGKNDIMFNNRKRENISNCNTHAFKLYLQLLLKLVVNENANSQICPGPRYLDSVQRIYKSCSNDSDEDWSMLLNCSFFCVLINMKYSGRADWI